MGRSTEGPRKREEGPAMGKEGGIPRPHVTNSPSKLAIRKGCITVENAFLLKTAIKKISKDFLGNKRNKALFKL